VVTHWNCFCLIPV